MRSSIFGVIVLILGILTQGCGTSGFMARQNWSARMPLDPVGASSLPETRASYSSRTVGFDGREEVHQSVNRQDVYTSYGITRSGGLVPQTVVVESQYETHYTNNIPRYYGVPGGYTTDPRGPKAGTVYGPPRPY
jgi:hypothetical protein